MTKPVSIIDVLNKLKTDRTQKVVKTAGYLVHDEITGSSVSFKPMYQLYNGHTPGNTLEQFTIIDKDLRILNRDELELCIYRMKDKDFQALPQQEKYSQIATKNVYETRAPIVLSRVLPALEKKGITWEKLMRFLVDDSGMKDERLVSMFLASMMNFGYDIDYQRLNNHSITLTNPGTGKSMSVTNITGSTGLLDFTPIGLFGSITSDGLQVTGALHGTGILAFEEFTNIKDHLNTDIRRGVFNELLNYTEDGQTYRVTGRGKTLVRGTKACHFISNCSSTFLCQSDFMSAIAKLTKLDRAGVLAERVAHIHYGEYAKLRGAVGLGNPTKRSEAVKKARMIYEEMMLQCQPVAMRLIQAKSDWYYERDDDYVQRIDEVSDMYFRDNDAMRAFAEGMRFSVPRLKCAAVRKVIVCHLDELASVGVKGFFRRHQKEVDAAYELFKCANLTSLEAMKLPNSRIFKMVEMLEQAQKDGLDPRTYMIETKRTKMVKLYLEKVDEYLDYLDQAIVIFNKKHRG